MVKPLKQNWTKEAMRLIRVTSLLMKSRCTRAPAKVGSAQLQMSFSPLVFAQLHEGGGRSVFLGRWVGVCFGWELLPRRLTTATTPWLMQALLEGYNWLLPI